MERVRFMEIVKKLRSSNLQANIGTNMSTTVIWSDVQASDLNLVPEVERYNPKTLRFDGVYLVDVLGYGEYKEHAAVLDDVVDEERNGDEDVFKFQKK